MFLSVSHNLKTPLNSIRLITDSLEYEESIEKVHQNLKIIKYNNILLE